MRASGKRKIAAVVLGAALVITLAVFVISGSVGDPSIPDGAVAIVEDAPGGTITDEEFQANLRQAAFQLQLRELPPADDPRFEQIEQSALANAIQTRWFQGEASERGVSVDERDIETELQTIIEEQLGGQKGYEQFLKRSEIGGEPAFTEEDVRAVAELTALRARLEEQALPAPKVTDEDIESYYEARREELEQPETRDVRVILNPDAAEIDAALEQLGTDPSPGDWEKVAKKYSTDEATKSQGGLREGVSEGQNEPALDEAIFGAETGAVEGPIEGTSGSYAIQVEAVTEAETTPLEEVRDQIKATLEQSISQQATTTFNSEFFAKWTSRTFCEEDLRMDLCANADPPPDACLIDDEDEREAADPATLEAGCPAPAQPRGVINPGTGGVIPGEQLPVLPQGPIRPPSEAALPTGLPGGVPLGPGGAPPPTSGAPPPPP